MRVCLSHCGRQSRGIFWTQCHRGLCQNYRSRSRGRVCCSTRWNPAQPWSGWNRRVGMLADKFFPFYFSQYRYLSYCPTVSTVKVKWKLWIEPFSMAIPGLRVVEYSRGRRTATVTWRHVSGLGHGNMPDAQSILNIARVCSKLQ